MLFPVWQITELLRCLIGDSSEYSEMNLSWAFGLFLCLLNHICNGLQREVEKTSASNIAQEKANGYHDSLEEDADLAANVAMDVLYINEVTSSDSREDDFTTDVDAGDTVDIDVSGIHLGDNFQHTCHDASGNLASGKYLLRFQYF